MIYYIAAEPAIRFAAHELARYLRKMTGETVRSRAVAAYDPKRSGIYLVLPRYLPEQLITESRWDDAYAIVSTAHNLLLTGANGRSILFAVYHWLELLGARWVHPGKDGEILPSILLPSLTVWDIHEKAANRHRGIVIEGSCSLTHVRDLIDWMPRMRLNAYMLQFTTAAIFWRRWYARENLASIRQPHELTVAECAELDTKVISTLKQRGLLLHRVGHGWTCAAVGHTAYGWETAGNAPEVMRPMLAEVQGVRDWFQGIPINTELCYNNPEVRARFSATVLEYARQHPEVDVLHVWASDGLNNYCECADCAKKSPSDWYITLINEIAPRLKSVAPEMRMVVLCYTNTLWPPQQTTPAGLGDNVTFMFAPISRCYAHSILDSQCTEGQPAQPFARNAVTPPRANADFAIILRAWQQYLPPGTDAFVFDYHLWWNISNDLLATNLSSLFPRDIQDYRQAGLNGMLSCQVQRAFTPTALPMVAMAHALWNPDTNSKLIEAQYLAAAFGPNADLATGFLADFIAATGACAHGNDWSVEVSVEKATAVLSVLASYLLQVRAAVQACDKPVEKCSLQLLLFYIQFQTYIWQALQAHAVGDAAAAITLLGKAITYTEQNENRLQRYMDMPYWTEPLRAIQQRWGVGKELGARRRSLELEVRS